MSWQTRLKNSLMGTLNEKIYFLHIPKCGGTSIRHAMADCYTTLHRRQGDRVIRIDSLATKNTRNLLDTEYGDRFEHRRIGEQTLLYYMSGRAVRFISGHVPFSNVAHRNFDFAFVTLLRDPIERWLSEYTFNKYHANKQGQLDVELGHYEMDMDEYLISTRGWAQGAQYSLFLGGYVEGRDYRSGEAVRQATENLQKCAVAGCLEDLGNFAERFRSRFGKQLNIGHRNINPRPESWKKDTVNDQIRIRIENLCEPDLEIYHYAREKLNS